MLSDKHLTANMGPHRESSQPCFVETSEAGKQPAPLKTPHRPELLLHRHCTMQNVGLSDVNALRGSKIHKMIKSPQDSG